MNRYPFWRYALIGLALIFSLIYTLPNFYGESPAVQISSQKATIKVDAATESQALAALDKAGIPNTGVLRDDNSVKIRFESTDTQLRARDVLEKAMNPDPADPVYITALNLLSASPTWLSHLRALPMYLGLDLRGGVHFLMQIDTTEALNKRLDSAMADVRTLLRDRKVRHSGIKRNGRQLVLDFASEDARTRAQELLRDNQADLAVQERGSGAQSQLLLTILVLMHLTRDRRRAFVQARAEAEAENETVSSEALPPDSSTRHVDQNARSLRLTGYAINTVLAGCSAALVTDLLGFTRLARFISASTLNSLFAGVILLAGSLVLLSLLRLAGNLRPLNRLKMLDEDGALIEARLRRVVYWVAVLLWTGYTLNQVMLLSPITDALGDFLSTPMKIGQISVSLADMLRFLVLVWLTLQVSRLLRYVLDREVYTRVSLSPGIPYALNSILNYVVLIGGLLMAIASTGVSLDRFTIFASALGVGVGFGLQSIVNNFVSGLIVLFERPIKVGDSVDMAGQSGKVKRIGIRASVLRTGAGADVIVPNSQLIANQVVNWTLSDHLRRIEIGLGVAYDSDPKQVIKLLTEVAREHADLLATPAPTAQFTDFGASALQFKLYAWTARGERLGGIRSELCIAIHERLKTEGIVLASS